MCVYIYRHLYSYPYRRHYWHSLDSKRNSWICDGARISSLFRLSVSLAARRIAIGNDWDLSGRGAEHSHFSLPSFRDVHLGNGQGAERERERESPGALSYFFFSSRSTGSIRFGWVQEGNGNDHLSGRYSPFSVGSSLRACPCPSILSLS